MWRINNFMLSIVLAATILLMGTGGFFLLKASWSAYKGAQTQQARLLDTNKKTNEEGQKLRHHQISIGSVQEHDKWGPWSIVHITHTGLRTPEIIDESERSVTISAQSRRAYRRQLYANNLVLRNADTGAERILFPNKVDIKSKVAVNSVAFQGIAVAFSEKDTSGDGKLNDLDDVNIRSFSFNNGKTHDIEFEGNFERFVHIDHYSETFEKSVDVFRFSVFHDENNDGSYQRDFEAKEIYEVAIDTGAVKKVVSDETRNELQAILDRTED